MYSKFSWQFTVQSRGMGRPCFVRIRGDDLQELHMQAHELAESMFGKCAHCTSCGYGITTLDGAPVPGGMVTCQWVQSQETLTRRKPAP